MEFDKNLQVFNKLKGLTEIFWNEWYGNSKEIKFSGIIFIECCNYNYSWHKYKICIVHMSTICLQNVWKILVTKYFNVPSLRRLWSIILFLVKFDVHKIVTFKEEHKLYLYRSRDETQNISKLKLRIWNLWVVNFFPGFKILQAKRNENVSK